MQSVFDLLSDSTFVAFGWALVHSLWQGTLLAGLFLGFAYLLRHKSAQVRYNLGVVTLSLQVLVSLSTFLFYKLSFKVSPSQTSLMGISREFAEAEGPRDIHQQLSFAQSVYFWISAHISELVICWTIGASLLMLRFAGAWVYARILRSRSMPVKDRTWLVRFGVLVAKLNVSQSVELRETAKIMTPVAIGFFKPVVLIPVGLLTGFSTSQVEAILLHELAHIRRNDYLVNLLQSFVEVIFFFHPALWWLSEKIRTEREHCCDDIALSICHDKMTYARALVKVAEWQASPKLAMAFATKKTLLHRISRVLGVNPKQNHQKLNWMTALFFTPLFIGLSFFAIGQKQNSTPEKSTPAKVKIEGRTTYAEADPKISIETKVENDIEIADPEITFDFAPDLNIEVFISDTMRKNMEAEHQKLDQLQRQLSPLHSKMEELHRKMEIENFQLERLDREMQKLDWRRSKLYDERSKFLSQREALMNGNPQKGKPQLTDVELEKQIEQFEAKIKAEEGQIEAFNNQISAVSKQAQELRESQEMKNLDVEIENVQNSIDEIQEQIETESRMIEKFEWVAPEPAVAPVPSSKSKAPKPPKPAKPVKAPKPPKPAKAAPVPPVAPEKNN